MMRMNQIKWVQIYEDTQVDNLYIGYGEETWEAQYRNGFLIRHVRYDLNEGDESNRIENLIYIPA